MLELRKKRINSRLRGIVGSCAPEKHGLCLDQPTVYHERVLDQAESGGRERAFSTSLSVGKPKIGM